MDFRKLLVVAKDFELIPTIVNKKHCSELYERICVQSQVAPQLGITVKGFMELLGVMALTSSWLHEVAGLDSATDRVALLLMKLLLFAFSLSHPCGFNRLWVIAVTLSALRCNRWQDY